MFGSVCISKTYPRNILCDKIRSSKIIRINFLSKSLSVSSEFQHQNPSYQSLREFAITCCECAHSEAYIHFFQRVSLSTGYDSQISIDFQVKSSSLQSYVNLANTSKPFHHEVQSVMKLRTELIFNHKIRHNCQPHSVTLSDIPHLCISGYNWSLKYLIHEILFFTQTFILISMAHPGKEPKLLNPTFIFGGVEETSEGERTTHAASCHCGAVKFNVTLKWPFPKYPVNRCTCSICSTTGYLLVYPCRRDIEWLQGKLYCFESFEERMIGHS